MRKYVALGIKFLFVLTTDFDFREISISTNKVQKKKPCVKKYYLLFYTVVCYILSIDR